FLRADGSHLHAGAVRGVNFLGSGAALLLVLEPGAAREETEGKDGDECSHGGGWMGLVLGQTWLRRLITGELVAVARTVYFPNSPVCSGQAVTERTPLKLISRSGTPLNWLVSRMRTEPRKRTWLLPVKLSNSTSPLPNVTLRSSPSSTVTPVGRKVRTPAPRSTV